MRLAEKSHPVEPVPVEIIIPLDLNFPKYVLSTMSLYILVFPVSYSATNISFNTNLLIFSPVTGLSIWKLILCL